MATSRWTFQTPYRIITPKLSAWTWRSQIYFQPTLWFDHKLCSQCRYISWQIRKCIGFLSGCNSLCFLTPSYVFYGSCPAVIEHVMNTSSSFPVFLQMKHVLQWKFSGCPKVPVHPPMNWRCCAPRRTDVWPRFNPACCCVRRSCKTVSHESLRTATDACAQCVCVSMCGGFDLKMTRDPIQAPHFLPDGNPSPGCVVFTLDNMLKHISSPQWAVPPQDHPAPCKVCCWARCFSARPSPAGGQTTGIYQNKLSPLSSTGAGCSDTANCVHGAQ